MKASGAPKVKNLGASGENDGDDAGFAGHPACLVGADGLASVEVGWFQAAEEGVEVEVDDRGGGGAAGSWCVFGAEGFDEFAERFTHPLGCGCFPLIELVEITLNRRFCRSRWLRRRASAVGIRWLRRRASAVSKPRGLVLGCSEREEQFLQHRRLSEGDGEASVDGAGAVVVHGQLRLVPGGVFFFRQLFGFERFRTFRIDDLPHPPPEDPQGLGVELFRVLDQGFLDQGDGLGRAPVRRQSFDSLSDHTGLLNVEVTTTQCSPGLVPRIECFGMPDPSVGFGPSELGGVGQPVRRTRSTTLCGNVTPVGLGQNPAA